MICGLNFDLNRSKQGDLNTTVLHQKMFNVSLKHRAELHGDSGIIQGIDIKKQHHHNIQVQAHSSS